MLPSKILVVCLALFFENAQKNNASKSTGDKVFPFIGVNGSAARRKHYQRPSVSVCPVFVCSIPITNRFVV